MTTQQALANRIAALCRERNLTINGLSYVSGVANSTIQNIFYAKSRNPGVVTIKKLCDGLGITLGEFFATPEFDTLDQEIR